MIDSGGDHSPLLDPRATPYKKVYGLWVDSGGAALKHENTISMGVRTNATLKVSVETLQAQNTLEVSICADSRSGLYLKTGALLFNAVMQHTI